MPKLGMEPIRKAALVKATIAEIGRAGSLDVTVSQIARRAGMSSALAHHYFGTKEQMFLAAMRHVLSLYGAEVRGALATAEGPRVYQRRLRSNLLAELRPLVGERALGVADGVGALIDGVYIREALSDRAPDGAAAARIVLAYLEAKVDCEGRA